MVVIKYVMSGGIAVTRTFTKCTRIKTLQDIKNLILPTKIPVKVIIHFKFYVEI
jgi:hypothetical protein